jgi:hypothetical protein
MGRSDVRGNSLSGVLCKDMGNPRFPTVRPLAVALHKTELGVTFCA